jgi:hypothetical protein
MWIVRVALDRPYTFIVLALMMMRGEFDPELEYDDPIKCKSIVVRVGPIPRGNLALALTCRKVDRKDAVLL